MLRLKLSTRPWFVAVVAAGVIGAGGTAYAVTQGGPAQEPAGLAREPGGASPPRIVPDWPTNASGQTYGSLQDANSPEDAPDLIQVETQEGKTGFVKRDELDSATGANVANPAEALEWQKSVDALAASGHRILLPAYEQDGLTAVGSFLVDFSQPDPKAR